MKSFITPRFVGFVVGSFLTISHSHAATFVWDGNLLTSGAQDVTGTYSWALGDLDFWDGTTNVATTNDTTTDIAQFGNGGTISTSAAIINVGTQSIGGLIFGATTTNGYTLTASSSGQMLTIGGSGITMNSGAQATSLGSANLGITLGAAQSWTNNDDSLLTIGGAVNNAGYLLTVGGTGNTTISGAVEGTGGLTKVGNGTLILSNANTYSGDTTLNAGTLQASTASSSLTPPSPFGSSSLKLNGGTLQLRANGGGTNLTQTITFGNNVTVGGNVAIDVGQQGGSVTNKTITLGTLSIGANTLTTSAATGTYALQFGTTTASGAAILNSNSGGSTAQGLKLGDLTLDNSIGTGTTTTITVGGSGYTTINGAITNNSLDSTKKLALTKNDAGVLNLNGTSSFTGGMTINNGTVNLLTNQTFGGGMILNAGTLNGSVVQNFTGGLTVNGGTLTTGNFLQNIALTFEGNAGTTAGGTGTWHSAAIGSAATFTLNAVTSGNSTTSHTFTNGLSGSGTLRFTGGTTNTPQPKTLDIKNSSGFTGNILLDYTAVSTTSQLAFTDLGDGGKISYDGGSARQILSLDYTGAGKTFNTRQLEISSDMNNASFLDPGIQVNSNGTGALIFNSDLLNTSTGTSKPLVLSGTTAGIRNEFNGRILNGSAVLRLQKSGVSTWVISNSLNSYTGGTTISDGTLQFTKPTAMPATGTVAVSATGTLAVNAGAASGEFTNATSGSGSIGGLIAGVGGQGAAVTWASGTKLGIDTTNAVDGTMTYSGVISGVLGLTKLGANTSLVLDQANTFTGATTISNGTLKLNNNLALQNSALTFSAASQLDLSGVTTPTIGGLNSSVNLALVTGYNSNVTALTLNPGTGVTATYSGIISNGAAANLTLTKNGAGTQILSNNTFTGNVVVNGGTLQLAGTNAFTDIAVNGATLTSGGTNVGPLTLGVAGGTITFTGTSVYNPQRDLAAAYNKNVNISSGTTTFQQSTQFYNETFSGVLSGAGTLVKNDSNGQLIFSNSANSFTGAIRLDNGSGGLTVSSLADSANPITLNGNTGGFNLGGGSGTSASLVFNTRQIVLANSGATTGAINNNNTDSTKTITINTNLGFSGAGVRTLTLGGSNTGANRFDGDITNNPNASEAVTLSKAGTGTWALSGTNTYSGITDLQAASGVLILQGSQSLSTNTPKIQFTQSSSSVGSLRLLDDGAGTISFNKPIEFGGTNTSQVLNLFVGNNNIWNGGNSAGTTTGSTIQAGSITFTSTAADTATTSINVTGANDYRLRTGTITLNNLVSRTAGQTTVTALNPTSANMTVAAITMGTGNTGIANDGVPVVRLDGLSSNNIVTGAISNASDGPGFGSGQALSLQKQNSSIWTLQGTNTYTGATTISGGILRVDGSLHASSAVTVSGGAIGGTGTIGGSLSLTTAGGINLADGSVGGTPLTVSGTLASSGAAGLNNFFFDLASGGTTTDKIVASGAFNMTTPGAVVVNVNQLGGSGNRLTAGTYDILTAVSGSALTAGGGNFRLATTKAFGQTFSLSNSTTTALKLTTTQVTSTVASTTLSGTAPSWLTVGNFSGGSVPDYGSAVTINSAIGTSSLNASQNINSLTYGTGATTGTTIQAGTAASGVASNMLVLEASGGTGITVSNATSVNHTISANIGLASNQTWNVGGSTSGTTNALSISGTISDFGAGYGITKTGNGLLNISTVAPTYSGTTTISGGGILYNSTQPSGNITITSGVFEGYFGGTYARTLGTGAGQIQVTGGVSGFSGQGATTSAFNITNASGGPIVWGSTYFNPSEFILQSAFTNANSGNSTFSSSIDLNGSNRTIRSDQNNSTYGGGGTFSGNISNSTGTAGLTKAGIGLHYFTGTNTYNGGTTISGGVLQFSTRASMPATGAVSVSDGATLGVAVASTGTTWGGGASNAGIAGLTNGLGGQAGSTVSFAGNSSLLLNVTGDTTESNPVSNGGATNLSLIKIGANALTLSNNNSFSGSVTLNAGSLTLSGNNTFSTATVNAGTLVLGGDNAMTGAVNLNANTLTLAHANAIDTSTGVAALTGATLNLRNNSATIFNTPLTTLNTTGTASMTINVNNISTGSGNALTLNGGLFVSNAHGNVTTLNFTGGNSYSLSIPTLRLQASSSGGGGGGLTLTPSVNVAVGALNIPVSNKVQLITLDGTTTGNTLGSINNTSGQAISLTKSSTSTWTLTGSNNYAGTTTISGGVLDVGVMSSGSLPSASWLSLGAGQLQGSGTFNRPVNASGAGNWNPTTAGSGGFSARGGKLTINTSSFTTSSTLLNTLILNSSTSDSELEWASNFILGNNAVRNIQVNSGVNANSFATISGAIGGGLGTIFTKTGTGKLVLTNTTSSWAGSGSGGTVIQAGTLVAGNNAPATGATGLFGHSGSGSVANTGAAGAIALGNGSTGVNDAPALLINSGFTVGRDIQVGALANTAAYKATLGGNNTSGTSTFSGNITLATTATNYSVTLQAATGGTVEFITGTWTNAGNKGISFGSSGNTGTVLLSNVLPNASGAMAVKFGTLQLGGAAVLGASAVTASVDSGAVLDVNGQTVTNTYALTLNGTGISSGGALISSTGSGSYAGSVTLASDSSIGGAGNLSIGGAIGQSGGTRALTKVGNGTLTLTNTNTYTGATTINGGILQLSGSGSINGSNVTVNAGSFVNNSSVAYTGILTLNNANLGGGTIDGSITYSGGGTVSSSSSVTGSVGSSSGSFEIQSGANLTVGSGLNVSGTAGLVIASNASVTGSLNYSSSENSTIAGAIAGTSQTLTKSGSSTLTLSGTNTYTGATNINNGIFAVTGAGSINDTSAINVAAGAKFVYNSSTALTVAPTLNGGSGNQARFSGTATINAAMSLNSIDDVLAPGNSPGIQNFATGQTWESFSYEWELNDWVEAVAGVDYDQIQITGGLTLSGASYALNIFSLDSLNMAGLVGANGGNPFTETSKSWTILTTTGGITGFNASSWSVNSTNFQDTVAGQWSLAESGNNLVLSYTVIPEPKAALLGGLGILLLLRRRR